MDVCKYNIYRKNDLKKRPMYNMGAGWHCMVRGGINGAYVGKNIY